MPTLTPFRDRLPIPKVLPPSGTLHNCNYYKISISQFTQRLHSELPSETTVWGFNGRYPGPIIEVRSGEQVVVDWCNELPPTHLITPVTDMPTPMPMGSCPPGANPVRTSIHLHGGHTPSESDGHPLDFVEPGHTRRDTYPNRQPATLLWYHDHAMCVTRLNVYAGLAGPYLIRDEVEDGLNLPNGPYEIPLIIQDRLFTDGGQLLYQTSMATPEFFGDTALVNGMVWPYLEVEPRKYRLRVLNGSNARFYLLSFSNGAEFTQIGSDGGLLPAPVQRTSIMLAPAERADLIVDFATMTGNVVLENKAQAPFPSGGSPDIPQIMQFRVRPGVVNDPSSIPTALVPIVPPVTNGIGVRDLVLTEIPNPHQTLINGKGFMDPATEAPVLDVPEVWQLYNTTVDAHPIHLHLVQFQVVDRQDFTTPSDPAWSFAPAGNAQGPLPGEGGWKDTVIAPRQKVTRILVKFTDYTGRYVWHCHILEHEENDMMRPLLVMPRPGGPMTV